MNSAKNIDFLIQSLSKDQKTLCEGQIVKGEANAIIETIAGLKTARNDYISSEVLALTPEAKAALDARRDAESKRAVDYITDSIKMIDSIADKYNIPSFSETRDHSPEGVIHTAIKYDYDAAGLMQDELRYVYEKGTEEIFNSIQNDNVQRKGESYDKLREAAKSTPVKSENKLIQSLSNRLNTSGGYNSYGSFGPGGPGGPKV